MFKFLKNLLFPKRNKVIQFPKKPSRKIKEITDGDLFIKLDKEKGNMIIETDRDLSKEEILELIRKHIDD